VWSACPSTSISLEPLDRCSRNLCGPPVALARSTSGGVAICCVLPVLWMRSYLAVMGRMALAAHTARVWCLWMPTYSAPVGCGVSWSTRLVCASVREHIAGPIGTKFVCGSLVAVARSSASGVALRYVLTVLWNVTFGRNGPCALRGRPDGLQIAASSCATGGSSYACSNMYKYATENLGAGSRMFSCVYVRDWVYASRKPRNPISRNQ